MKKIAKIIGIILLIPIILVCALLTILSLAPMTPTDYTQKTKTGGSIEAKYLAMGKHEVRKMKRKGSALTKEFHIYYPKTLMDSNPVVIILNGTGVLPKKYKALFEHLASWGFVVIGNDDESTGFGKSADETIEFIQSENNNSQSVLYHRLDLDNIGITGHSQGGAGVFTAISVMEHKDKYKTAITLSPTYEEMAHQLGWKYDLTQISIPTLMIAGTNGDFETQLVIPLEKMTEMYDKIPSPKVMLRRIGAEHGQMLYSADGYVTAWLMWQLQNDAEAGKAFVGKDAEIIQNNLYQHVKKDM